MNSLANLVRFKIYDKVGYYTIISEDKENSEAKDFFIRMKQIPEVDVFIKRMVYWMQQIGMRGIFDNMLFRHEGICVALPPDRSFSKEENEIRLYCCLLTNNIVVLFNGDWKTPGAESSQQCPRVEPHRRRAERWTTKVEKEKEMMDIKFNIIINSDQIFINY